jgi:hypothetical protein
MNCDHRCFDEESSFRVFENVNTLVEHRPTWIRAFCGGDQNQRKRDRDSGTRQNNLSTIDNTSVDAKSKAWHTIDTIE